MRHGKPDAPKSGKLSAHEFHRWMDAYNLASLNTSQQPPKQILAIASKCNILICSDLRRSIHSAELLGVIDIACIDEIFREVELPYCTTSIPRLSPASWSIMLRILWFMGYSANCESKAAAKRRAAAAADILHDKALANNTVLLVGHSIFNNFIGKQLKAKGWQGSASIFSKYWAISEYEYFVA